MLSRYESARVYLRRRRACCVPVRCRRFGWIFSDDAGELLAFGQLAIRNCVIALGIADFSICRDQRIAVGVQLLRSHVDEQIPCCHRHCAQLTAHDRCGAASECAHIERRQFGVRHSELHRSQRHTQLFGYLLAQGCSDVLPDFYLSRRHHHMSLREPDPG